MRDNVANEGYLEAAIGLNLRINIPELSYTDFVTQHQLYSDNANDTSDLSSVPLTNENNVALANLYQT